MLMDLSSEEILRKTPAEDMAHRPQCPRCGDNYTDQDWFYSEGMRMWSCSSCGHVLTRFQMWDDTYNPHDHGLPFGHWPGQHSDR